MLTMILQSRHVKAKLTMAQRSGELAQVTPPSSPASSRAPQGSRFRHAVVRTGGVDGLALQVGSVTIL